MKRPAKRPNLPPRRADNEKRRLKESPSLEELTQLKSNIIYEGSSKHKQHPHLFGLEPYRGIRGDETLCDRDAGFSPNDMKSIETIMKRGLEAGLLGGSGIIWAVADNGWVYEARITNRNQSIYHGYPVRDTEAIAEEVIRRFSDWAEEHGGETDRQAARNSKGLYGIT